MPTELRDAWPSYKKNENEFCSETKPTISARQVEPPELDLREIYAALHEIKREQSQRMTIFTAVVIVMMLSFMNQLDALKKDIRQLVAAQRGMF